MKTYILQLEAHDDVVSVSDRMAWSKAARILLVWPRRGVILHRQMDLVLVHRRGLELGAQVGLVTRDLVVRSHAREIGLPVFSSVDRAQQQTWPQNWQRRRFPLTPLHPLAVPESLRVQQMELHAAKPGWWDQPTVRMVAFSLGILAVIALAMFFYPSARVTLTPIEREQSAVFPVWASLAITAIGPSGGMPAREVTVTVEGQGQIETTGSAQIATRFATGSAHFANLTGQPVEAPAGVVIRTLTDPPVRLITTADLHLPAGPDGAADVPIQALQPGVEGNVAAGEIKAVEGEIGLRVVVTNPVALQGGEQASARASTPADIDRLRQRLTDELADQAVAQLTGSLGTSGHPIPSTATMKRILDEKLDPPAGQAGDVVRMTLRAEYTIWVVSDSDLQAAAQVGLDASLPADFESVSGTLTVIPAGEAQYIDGKLARWQVQATRQVRGVWTHDKVVSRSMGRTISEASQSLQSGFALAAAPEIQVFPSWWARLPALPFRIEVVSP